MGKQTIIKKDITKKQLIITREFEAPVELVWRAWTEAELLSEWWAPKPYKAVTVKMDFRNGGRWHYYMLGPDGSKLYCLADYSNIIPQKSYNATDAFCDVNEKPNTGHPNMNWKNSFSETTDGNTIVLIEITFKEIADMEKIIEMGFEQGFTIAHGNLDEYLKAQFKLRNELNANSAPRVTTYLNFPGNTEEAFNFYKTVFGTEFSGKGIQRFGDIPAEAGHPPVADNVKKMILHIELPILGGHVLMATDSPKEMGFSVVQGNNMHIFLEPQTRKETKRLFDGLSQEGMISMPLQDMFFGSYFGSCTDRFGINWMFNCVEKN